MNIFNLFKLKTVREKSVILAKKLEKKYVGRVVIPVEVITYSSEIKRGAIVVFDRTNGVLHTDGVCTYEVYKGKILHMGSVYGFCPAKIYSIDPELTARHFDMKDGDSAYIPRTETKKQTQSNTATSNSSCTAEDVAVGIVAAPLVAGALAIAVLEDILP